MSDFESFWETKVGDLKDDYVDASGKIASCGTIALQTAEALASRDVSPKLLFLQSDETTLATMFSSCLTPVPYDGKRIWMFHIVCADNDIIYDPMLESPLPYDRYTIAGFGEEKLAVTKTMIWTPGMK